MTEEKSKLPLILDGDPGHDDAIAWLLAEASRRTDGICDIRAVTTVGATSPWIRPHIMHRESVRF